MPDQDFTTKWWVKSILHHCFIHPLMPLADRLYINTPIKSKRSRLANVVYRYHDRTAPS